MFEPVKMVKVSVVGSKDFLKETSEILYRLNLIHIEDYTEDDRYFKIGEPFEEASKFSRFLVSLRSILSQVKSDEKPPERIFSVKELSLNLDEKINEIEREVGERLNEIRKIEENLRRLNEEEESINPLIILGIPADLLKDYKNIEVFVGFVKENPFEKILEITKDFELEIKSYNDEYIMALFVKKEFADDVFKTLQEFAFKEIKVPDITVSYEKRLEEIKEEREKLENRINQLREEIKRYQQENLDLMLALEEYLSIELEKSELPLKIATSKYAFIIVGYIPADNFDKFKKEVEERTNGKVIVTEVRDDKWTPPTAFKNSSYSKPFELLTTSFAIPKYTEVDPTTVMSIFFPIFFGLMLGDIGYGIVILAISLWLSKKFTSEGWQSLLKILLYSSISTIIFGFIYGEFFGFELFGHETIFIRIFGESELALKFEQMRPLINRLHEAPLMLVLTIAIGVLHMALGYIFGIRNYIREHGLKHAIKEKFNWLLALISIALIITGFIINTLNGYPAFAINTVYILAIPPFIAWVILTITGEGAMFLIEYLTLLSNTISYARLLAVGLASVGFAIAFNKMAFDMLWPLGPIGIVIAIFILLIGHFINLLLGILDPGLQSLRLHYVEFFVKFFEGGGILYSPFGRRRKYTKED